MLSSDPVFRTTAYPNNTVNVKIISSLIALPLAASAQVMEFNFLTDGAANFQSIDATTQSPFLVGNGNVTPSSVGTAYNPDFGIITTGWTMGDSRDWFNSLSFNLTIDPAAAGSLTGITLGHASTDFSTSPRLWAARVLDSSNNVVSTTNTQFYSSAFFPTLTTTTQVADFTTPFDVTAGESYRVEYTAWGGSQSDSVFISSASINGNLQAIPEPSSLLLCSFAFTGLLLTRKRK